MQRRKKAHLSEAMRQMHRAGVGRTVDALPTGQPRFDDF